jgi:hypothetical protein
MSRGERAFCCRSQHALQITLSQGVVGDTGVEQFPNSAETRGIQKNAMQNPMHALRGLAIGPQQSDAESHALSRLQEDGSNFVRVVKRGGRHP